MEKQQNYLELMTAYYNAVINNRKGELEKYIGKELMETLDRNSYFYKIEVDKEYITYYFYTQAVETGEYKKRMERVKKPEGDNLNLIQLFLDTFYYIHEGE